MNKVYLITGASSDLGIALIKRVFRPGDIIFAQVCSHDEELKPICEAFPDSVHIFKHDLTQPEECEAFISEVKATGMIPTHIVHLPALRVKNTKFKNFDSERFQKDFLLQVESAIEICKAFLPLMAKKKFGRVLFIQSSYMLACPPKNTTAYVICKSAIAGLCKSLAAEYASSFITVNAVAPSMIETKFLSETPDLIVESAAADHPMGRNATVDDVVPAMAFLLSDEAGYITGVTLPITGGSIII